MLYSKENIKWDIHFAVEENIPAWMELVRLVIVPNVSHEAYHTEYDRSLLYIACTGDMHILSLYYTGKLTPLISEQKEKQT